MTTVLAFMTAYAAIGVWFSVKTYASMREQAPLLVEIVGEHMPERLFVVLAVFGLFWPAVFVWMLVEWGRGKR